MFQKRVLAIFLSLTILTIFTACGTTGEQTETPVDRTEEAPAQDTPQAADETTPESEKAEAESPPPAEPDAPAKKDTVTEKDKTPPVEKKKPDVAVSPLLDPSQATEQAPEQFRARFETTKGNFIISVTRSWSPRGADRLYNLVKIGYYDDVAIFRVVTGFVAQFGIHGNPKVNAAWRPATIQDDPVTKSNLRGWVSFATGGPNTRTTQLFINYKDNSGLDGMGFSPVGEVTEGMDVVDALYAGYHEKITQQQGNIHREGNAFLRRNYPDLDYIKKATILE